MPQYKSVVAHGSNLPDVMTQIETYATRALDEGWTPVGGPAVTSYVAFQLAQPKFYVVQAFIKV